MRCLEKNLGEKKNDFEQIAIMGEANLGEVPLQTHCNPYWVPIVTVIRSIQSSLWNYNRDPKAQAEVCLHPSRDLLKIKNFHPDFFSRHRMMFPKHKKRTESPESWPDEPELFFGTCHGILCPALCR